MKTLKYLLLTLMLIPLGAMAVAVKDVTNVHVADRTRYVTDMAGMLSPSAVTSLDSIMADIWRQTTAEPVIVIVDDLDGEDIDEYATELFDLWRPGKKDTDNGVILLISKNDRRFVLRTGYGVEGVLPDALCGVILNEYLKPQFRKGDYDAGVIDAARQMQLIMTDEAAREEMMSKYANDAGASRKDGADLFSIYLSIAFAVTLFFAALYVVNLIRARRKPTAQAYHPFDQMFFTVVLFTFLTLGMMLPVLAAWYLTMKHIRNKKHICTNCHSEMHKLDEQTDNLYLTPAQDTEEKLNSVDYDVWLCPTCNQTEIIPFINRQKNYSICNNCGARAAALVSDRVIVQPTVTREGKGVRTYRCFNCGKTTEVPYRLPKDAAPVVVVGGLGGLGSGGGGGFSGGSFGGGMTGGGGASGGW